MNCEECKERMWPENPEVGGYLPRTGQYFVPLCQGCSHSGDIQLTGLEDRINNLESISAMPGQIPRKYHDIFWEFALALPILILGCLCGLPSQLIEYLLNESNLDKVGRSIALFWEDSHLLRGSLATSSLYIPHNSFLSP